MTTDQPSLLDPSTLEYVLPAPPRTAGEVVVVAPRRDQTSPWRRGSDVARQLGDRFLAMAEGQQLFAAELRERLQTLDLAVADASRAQLKGSIRDVLAVLEWSEAVHADLVRESRLAANGAEPIDLADLCTEVAAQVRTAEQPIYVSGTAPLWWGPAPAVAAMVKQALQVVAERCQGIGARSLEISETGGGVRLWVTGTGEPGDAMDGDSIARFRRAVEQVGAAVQPDALGPGGVGMVLTLSRTATD